MSGACGDINFLEGGVIKDATITGSTITESTFTNGSVSNSILTGCEIQNLTSIDAASALTIANAIANLPAEQLTALAEALFKALAPKPGTAPTVTTGVPLTTSVCGDRRVLLGGADIYAKINDQYVVPAYKIS